MSFEAPKLPEGFYFNVTTFVDRDGDNVFVKLKEKDGLKILGIVFRDDSTVGYECLVTNNYLDTDHLHTAVEERMVALANKAQSIASHRARAPSTAGIAGNYPPKKIVGGSE